MWIWDKNHGVMRLIHDYPSNLTFTNSTNYISIVYFMHKQVNFLVLTFSKMHGSKLSASPRLQKFVFTHLFVGATNACPVEYLSSRK